MNSWRNNLQQARLCTYISRFTAHN